MSQINIREAQTADCQTILNFIMELAIYEKAGHEVKSDIKDIRRSLFAPDATARALLCSIDGKDVGYAVYFFNYSTWLGKNGLYLEDLYVTPAFRGRGAGKAILHYLARLALKKHCGRFEWSVLDWNEPAIKFYQSIGAVPMDEWTIYRLSGDALTEFAARQISISDKPA